MKRNEWRISKKTMGGHPCLEYKYNQELSGNPSFHELCIAGRYGEIWLKNDGIYRCVVQTTVIKKKVLSVLQVVKNIGNSDDDLLIDATPKMLDQIIKILDVPPSLLLQLEYVNTRA